MNIYYCLYVRQLQTTLSDTLHGVSMISLSLFLSPGLRAHLRGGRLSAGGTVCFALGLGGWADPIPRSVERPHPVILKGWAWLYSSRTRGEATKRRVPGVFAKTCFNFRPRQPCAGRCGAPLVRYQGKEVFTRASQLEDGCSPRGRPLNSVSI